MNKQAEETCGNCELFKKDCTGYLDKSGCVDFHPAPAERRCDPIGPIQSQPDTLRAGLIYAALHGHPEPPVGGGEETFWTMPADKLAEAFLQFPTPVRRDAIMDRLRQGDAYASLSSKYQALLSRAERMAEAAKIELDISWQRLPDTFEDEEFHSARLALRAALAEWDALKGN